MFDLIKKAINIVFAWKEQKEKGQNPIWSKTIWGLVITWGALALSRFAGVELTPEEQTGIMVVVGTLLRMITHKPVGFFEDKGNGTA